MSRTKKRSSPARTWLNIWQLLVDAKLTFLQDTHSPTKHLLEGKQGGEALRQGGRYTESSGFIFIMCGSVIWGK